MYKLTRRTVLRAFAIGPAGVLAVPAFAQAAWPTRPVHITVAYAAGSPIDNLTRFCTEYIHKRHPEMAFVVEYKPGAGGNIAADAVAKAQGDGHQFLVSGSSTHAANVSLYKSLAFDPEKDFAPTALLAAVPYLLLVNPAKVPVHSVAEFLSYAKARPGQLSYGSSAVTGRLAGEMLNQRAGIQTTFVSYKMLAQVVTDVVGGHLDYAFGDPTSFQAHVRSGRLRALAVSTRTRIAAAPDVPTLAEAGLVDFDVSAWLAVWGKANTPLDAVQKFNKLLNEALTSPEGQKYLAGSGLQALPGPPELLATTQRRDTVAWGQVIRAAGITVD